MRLVALIAVLAIVSVAPAADQAWFVATSGAAPITQGAAGVTLVLPSGGTYGIDMYINSVDCFGYNIDLKGPATALASGLTSIGVGTSGWVTDIATVGAGPADILHYGQSATAAATFNAIKIASFTLTLADNSDIIGGQRSDSPGWAAGDGTGQIGFGGFWAADGQPDSWADGPAIQSLPEPATLVLLGFGLVGLLRRR